MFRLKKATAVVICALVLLVLLFGCRAASNVGENNGVNTDSGDNAGASGEGLPEENPLNGDELESPFAIDYDSAFAAFEPDTAMVIVGDKTVTWAELFMFMRRNVDTIFGEVEDWGARMGDGRTFGEAMKLHALDDALLFLAYEHGANLTGVSLGEEESLMLSEYMNSMSEQAGNEEELHRLVWELHSIYSLELFEKLLRTEYLLSMIMVKLYGQDGELLPDEDIVAYAESEVFLMAKHIARLKTTHGNDTPRREIEAILQQLDEFEGDDFEAFFDELMFEHSEDTYGLSANPKGYLFKYGDIGPEFELAALGLLVGEYSDVVETGLGYHIILRVPIDFDTVPMGSAMLGDSRTLRLHAVFSVFDKLVLEWRDMLQYETTREFDSLDVAALF